MTDPMLIAGAILAFYTFVIWFGWKWRHAKVRFADHQFLDRINDPANDIADGFRAALARDDTEWGDWDARIAEAEAAYRGDVSVHKREAR